MYDESPLRMVLMLKKVASPLDYPMSEAPGWVYDYAASDPVGLMLTKMAEEELPPEAEMSLAHKQLAAQAQNNKEVALQVASQMQQAQAQAAQIQQQAQQMQAQYEQQMQQMQQQLQELQQQNAQLQQQLQVTQQDSVTAQEQVLQMRKLVQQYRQQLADLAGVDPTAQAAVAAPSQEAAHESEIPPKQILPSDAKKELEEAQKSQEQAAIQQQQAQQKIQEDAPKIQAAAQMAQANGLKAASFYLFGNTEPQALLKTALAIRLMERNQ